MSVKLKGEFYYDPQAIPVNVVRVATTGPEESAHPHDATEVEHYHEFAELVVILEGKGMQRIGGMDYPVQAGDVFLFQGRQSHYFHDRKNLVMVNVMYDADTLALPVNYLKRIPGYHAMFILEPHYRKTHKFSSRLHLGSIELGHLEEMLNSMMDEQRRKPPGHEAALYAGLVRMVVYLSRQYTKVQSSEAKELLRLGGILGEIEQNVGGKATLADMARKAGLSKVHFIRLFKRATGDTPLQYRVKNRVRKAMALLRDSPDLNITDVAYQCGFNDSNYFTRMFRKVAKTTPLKYRQSL